VKFSVVMDSLFGRQWKDKIFENMKIVADAGYDGIEFLNWEPKDIPVIKEHADKFGLSIAAFLTKCPCLGDANNHGQFLEDLKVSIDAANTLECASLIGQSGLVQMFLPEQTFWKNMVAVLKEASVLLEDAGITMVVEPVNTKVDHAGVFLSTSKDSFFLTSLVGSPNVKILYDLYHQQITDGNLLATIENNLDAIGHFHAAGCPGRNEITSGELNYPFIFEAIDRMGFDGYMGMEYRPTKDVFEGLVEARKLFSK
jgi:hydroxypyruvate isomerase